MSRRDDERVADILDAASEILIQASSASSSYGVRSSIGQVVRSSHNWASVASLLSS